MKIEKVTAVGAKFTYDITLSNISLYVEAYDVDGFANADDGEYEIIIYHGDTEREICSMSTSNDINNETEVWEYLTGSHILLKGILNFAYL